LLKNPQKSINLNELKAFNDDKVDSTGVNLWPSEEALGFYISKNLEQFIGKDIIELGAGYSGLASIIYLNYLTQKSCKDKMEICITDGNETCVQRLLDNLLLNKKIPENFDIYFEDKLVSTSTLSEKIAENTSQVKIQKLVWSMEYKSIKKYDRVIVSDCLFFENFHQELKHTLTELMKDDEESYCLILCPARNSTMKKFLISIEDTFVWKELDMDPELAKKTAIIKSHPEYDEDRDYIHTLKLMKKKLL